MPSYSRVNNISSQESDFRKVLHYPAIKYKNFHTKKTCALPMSIDTSQRLPQVSRAYCLVTIGVENFDEIALSQTVKETRISEIYRVSPAYLCSDIYYALSATKVSKMPVPIGIKGNNRV